MIKNSSYDFSKIGYQSIYDSVSKSAPAITKKKRKPDEQRTNKPCNLVHRALISEPSLSLQQHFTA